MHRRARAAAKWLGCSGAMATGSQGRRQHTAAPLHSQQAAIGSRERPSEYKSLTFLNPSRVAWPRSPSAPMETSFTPLLAMKSSALLTLEILWTLILPRSGLAKRSPGQGDGGKKKTCIKMLNAFDVTSLHQSHSSPEMTSSNSMSFSPSLKSSSMLSICVPAFLRWELHQAVNVCRRRRRE